MGQIPSRMQPALPLTSSIDVPSLANKEGSLIDKERVFDAIRAGNANSLSSLFSEGWVDLSAIDDGTGGTALHLAVLQRKGDLLEMLLDRVSDDPVILNAKDREGRTPLVCAAASANAPMMKALVDAGAGVDIHYPTGRELGLNANALTISIAAGTASAKILIGAKGDISTAFMIAVEQKDIFAQLTFYKGGAEKLLALENFVAQKKWGALESMFQYTPPNKGDVASVLEAAVRDADSEAIRQLIALDTRKEASIVLARYAISNNTKGVSELLNASSTPGTLSNYLNLRESLVTIAENKDLSDALKLSAMKRIVNPVGCDKALMDEVMQHDMLSKTFEDKKPNAVRLMVAAGVPATRAQLTELLIYLAENKQFADMAAVMSSGGDVGVAMDQLMNQINDLPVSGNDDAVRRKQDALNALVVAFVKESTM